MTFSILMLLNNCLGCGEHQHRRLLYAKDVAPLVKIEEESSEATLLKAIQTNDFVKFNSEFAKSNFSVNFEFPSGRTLLHEAIIWNSIDIVKFLMHEGADPLQLDKDGKSALDLAQGKTQILKLVKPGPSEEETNYFFGTIEKNQYSELKKILSQGFDPNVFSNQGETGLTLAIKLKFDNTVRVLMQSQVALDVNLVNQNGERPLTLAISMGLKRIEQMLRSKGAREI
jgi:ankyrin repeat protein